jgi:hypothetical protein
MTEKRPMPQSAGPPPINEEQVRNRTRALELAIETVRLAKSFSNFQIVHTADLYAKFIETGAVPPQPESVPDGVS